MGILYFLFRRKAEVVATDKYDKPLKNFMKKFGYKSIAPILLSLLLFGCAAVGVQKVEQLKPGTTIVPLSLMGDKLAIFHIGTTAFQNYLRHLEFPSWQIDAYAEAAAASAIRQGSIFSVPRTDTATARKSAGTLSFNAWTSAISIEGGPESITRLARDSGAEYVLVIGPSQMRDNIFGTEQPFSGYGILQRSFLGLERAVNYLTMQVVLFDGIDGKEVARMLGFHLNSPRAAEDWLESKNSSLTESNANTTRLAIESLIEKGLTKSLTELKLIPQQ